MDILEFAMKMEMDGKRFYEKAAQTETSAELKDILQMLAEEEQNHYEFFARMKRGLIESAAEAIATGSDTLKRVSNIFQELSENGEGKSFGDDRQAVWMEALRIEEKAEKFYRDKAAEETDKKRRELLNMVADEERNHVHMVDSVLTYLKFPEEFAESAQFKNFQSLEGR